MVKTTNPQGGVERRVETVKYDSSGGQGQQVRSVEVVHHLPPNTSDGVSAATGATSAAESILQSAKEAI